MLALGYSVEYQMLCVFASSADLNYREVIEFAKQYDASIRIERERVYLVCPQSYQPGTKAPLTPYNAQAQFYTAAALAGSARENLPLKPKTEGLLGRTIRICYRIGGKLHIYMGVVIEADEKGLTLDEAMSVGDGEVKPLDVPVQTFGNISEADIDIIK